MPPNNLSRSNVGKQVHLDNENENERMAVRASQAAAQKMMRNDSKRYRDHIQATTNTYGWNTVETGAPIPAMPTYPAPLPPHPNIKLPLNEKIKKAMNILTSNGLPAARQYLINTKATIEYKNTQAKGDGSKSNKVYTPEWILAQESVKRRLQQTAKNRNKEMETLRSLAHGAKGGRKQRMRKTLRKAHRRP